MVYEYLVIILATLIGIIELFRNKIKKIISEKYLRSILFLLIIFIGLFQWILIKENKFEVAYSKSSGLLHVGLEGKNITYPQIGPIVYVTNETAKNVAGHPIDVWIENGELKISTIIRDKSDSILAEIRANEWKVNPNLIYDRNFDKNAIEVINKNGEVILQVIFNGKQVELQMINFDENGKLLYWVHNATYWVISGSASANTTDFSIAPIFFYPSERYKGVRLKSLKSSKI